jgi:hypothetical protein
LNDEELTFAGGGFGGTAQSGKLNSAQIVIGGTQYHSTTVGYDAVDYTSSGKTHLGGTVIGRKSGAEGTIGDDTGSTIIFKPANGFKFINGEELIFTVINPEILFATKNQYTPHGLSDGPGGTTEWYSQGYDMGNANNWMVEYCRVAGCGGHGMYIEGDNVNVGTSIDFDASVNGGWGIYDNCFLGNTHIGAHVAANAKGAYRTSQHGNAHNTFIGCYSEGDYSPPSKIYTPSISLGGLMAAGFDNDSSGFRLDGSSMSPHVTTVHEPLDNNDIRLNFKDYVGASDINRGDIVTQTQVDSSTSPPTTVNLSATVEWISKQKDNIQITGINPTGVLFKDGLGLIFTRNGSRIGSATAKGIQHPAIKAITTNTAYQGGGGVPISGLQIGNTDDYLGISLGSYNREIDSWEFGRVNYPPSFRLLGGRYYGGFSVGDLFLNAKSTASGQGGIQSIIAIHGYPLGLDQWQNRFYPGQLILNMNTATDHIAGWICTEKCGVGARWKANVYTGSYESFIIPSENHPQSNKEYVYRKHESSVGNTTGGEEIAEYPEEIGVSKKEPASGIVWQCFGYRNKGLEEIVTRVPAAKLDIPTGINITSGQDLDITGHPFQKFGLISILSGNIGVKFSMLRPVNSGVTYYVQSTVQTANSTIISVIAKAQDDPDDLSKIMITIIGNRYADIITDVCWILKWS